MAHFDTHQNIDRSVYGLDITKGYEAGMKEGQDLCILPARCKHEYDYWMIRKYGEVNGTTVYEAVYAADYSSRKKPHSKLFRILTLANGDGELWGMNRYGSSTGITIPVPAQWL